MLARRDTNADTAATAATTAYIGASKGISQLVVVELASKDITQVVLESYGQG